MNNNKASEESMQGEGRVCGERRRFMKKLATAAIVISGGLLFPASALTWDKRSRNISKSIGKKKDLPLTAYPSFRKDSQTQKKCRTETYTYYHDASGTVKTLTRTVCD